jgi:hypothetical protein
MNMKTILAALLLAAAIPALVNADPSYDLKLSDPPATVTNATASAEIRIDVTKNTQFALSLTAHMEQTQVGGTNLVWYPGQVSCLASNSLDGYLWFYDPARSFSFTVGTNETVALLTNFTGVGSAGFVKYGVTISNNVNLEWKSATKPGL